MRTWQELIVEADATGTWATYIGDGFSVPFQTGWDYPPFIGGLARAYKAWLDSHYFEAARLHDWCYTPYGSLIGVTRAEADAAIRARILDIGGATSVIDAATVYAAVSTFGGPYFGSSQVDFNAALFRTAYDKIHGRSGPNMAFGPLLGGVPLSGGSNMPVKVVIVFQQVNTRGSSNPSIGLEASQRIAGWSESYLSSADNIPTVIAEITGPGSLLNRRAELLNSNAEILGVRLYLGGSGKGVFHSYRRPGTAGPADQPTSGMLIEGALGDSGRVSRRILRGIPDDWIVGGELKLYSTIESAIGRFFLTLYNLFGGMANIKGTEFDIFSVLNTGLLTLTDGVVPWAAGAVIQIQMTTNVDTGKRVSGQFLVQSIGPLPNQAQLAGWTAGECIGGKALNSAMEFKSFLPNTLIVVKAAIRKVGRPFGLYRGRQSNRRKTG